MNAFKKTVKMIDYDDFMADANHFSNYCRKILEENSKQVSFPVKVVSITVMNFKPVH